MSISSFGDRVRKAAAIASLGLVVLAMGANPPLRARADAQGPSNFTLVGSNPLLYRGENAAMALYDHYVYVGSRTDTSAGHVASGVLVVDVADPANPTVAGVADVDAPSFTSRELRVWPQQKLLMVLYFQCSVVLHQCASPADANGSLVSFVRFYDLANPAVPLLLSTYMAPRTPHEFFLWVDPKAPDVRALLYWTSPNTGTDSTTPNLIVTDISKARANTFTDLATINPNPLFGGASGDIRLHSVALSVDGTEAYLSYLGGGFLVMDTSDLASGVAQPQLRVVTPARNRVRSLTLPGTHSAVRIPGRPLVLTTDEVYGKIPGLLPTHGCPWGWMRVLDISDETHPTVLSEYHIAQNDPAFCAAVDTRTNTFTSYASHNPTVVGPLAFVTWHSGGLQAVDLTDPKHPTQAGYFMPTPLPAVATEDSALSVGGSQVVMWSYPIIRNGLIYVVDVRNGLYVLRYTGAHRDLLSTIGFLEGNSNLGDAGKLSTREVAPRGAMLRA